MYIDSCLKCTTSIHKNLGSILGTIIRSAIKIYSYFLKESCLPSEQFEIQIGLNQADFE